MYVNNKILIERFKKKHGDKYDYSLVDYKNMRTKVKIICKDHGMFYQNPKNHLQGNHCFKCSVIHRSYNINIKKEYFINMSNLIHNNKYDYSISEYTGSKNKIKIICPIHGVFEQYPDNHLKGHGCKYCGNKKMSIYNKENPIGWNISNWEKAACRSKNFDSFKVYIIRCYNNTEQFYKIGRTFQKTSKRFAGITAMPYQYDVLYEFILYTAKEAFDKESELKILHKKFKYSPLINFKGMHECFSKIKIRD